MAERAPQVRCPALPYLHRSLEEGATVIADDIDRLGEQRIVSRWEHELALRFERRHQVEGLVRDNRVEVRVLFAV